MSNYAKVAGYKPTTAPSPAGSPYANTSPATPSPGQEVAAPPEEFRNEGPSSDLILAKPVVSFVVDYTDIAAIATKYLGPTFPVGTMVLRSYYKVITTFQSAGADAGKIGIGFATDDSEGIVALTAISAGGNIWDAGWHNGIQAGTITDAGEILTAARQLQFTRSDQVLTAGKLVLFIEYGVYA